MIERLGTAIAIVLPTQWRKFPVCDEPEAGVEYATREPFTPTGRRR